MYQPSPQDSQRSTQALSTCSWPETMIWISVSGKTMLCSSPIDVVEISRVNAEKHLPSSWIETGRKKGNRGVDRRSPLNSASASDTSRSIDISEREQRVDLATIDPLRIMRTSRNGIFPPKRTAWAVSATFWRKRIRPLRAMPREQIRYNRFDRNAQEKGRNRIWR
jgi:hypothetical protein